MVVQVRQDLQTEQLCAGQPLLQGDQMVLLREVQTEELQLRIPKCDSESWSWRAKADKP